MNRPTDTVDIPDEREPEHNIPDAVDDWHPWNGPVCDAQTVLGDELTTRLVKWLDSRDRIGADEADGPIDSDRWHWSDDEAVDICHSVATLFEIISLPPPRAEDALTFDECEAAGVDGTLRYFGEMWNAMVGAEQMEGPTCSICDGLGHGYPGGGPCPLEERGYDAARQDEERF